MWLRKTLFLSFLLMLVVTGFSGGSAQALSCAPDPDRLTFRQMIAMGKTGDADHPMLLLGRVIEIRDHRRPGGNVVAVLRVWSAPVGHGTAYARVRFWVDRPNGPATPGARVYEKGERYAVVACRFADGSYADDGPCGATQRVWLAKFKDLLQLARENR